MGMFNSICAKVLCPLAGHVTENVEIQIKWQVPWARVLAVYHLGDTLPDIEPEYNNTWIKTDYICPSCSKHTTGRSGMKFIKTEDQCWHDVFVRIQDGKICQILTPQEFEQTGVHNFVTCL